MRPSDLGADPQLLHRGFFVTVEHSAMGPMRCDGFATRYSRTPARLRSGAPTLGEHTHYVLRELLGLSDDAISELAMAGALS
jgi:crotonobetainyl-CoA:carnitine CoA-transferase CaiB-like acyl-CoA transferase